VEPELNQWASNAAWQSYLTDEAMGKVVLVSGADRPLIVVASNDLDRLVLYSWCRVLGQA
jgi:hypothetical protein